MVVVVVVKEMAAPVRGIMVAAVVVVEPVIVQ